MPRTTLVTRIESDLKDRLSDAAKAQNRTVSNLVEWIIKQYLDQHHPQGETGTTVKTEAKDGGNV